MDRRILDKIFAKFAGLAGYSLLVVVGFIGLSTGFKLETMAFLAPASGFILAQKMLNYNSQFIGKNRLKKLRNKYIKAITKAINTNNFTPQIGKAIQRYDELLYENLAENIQITQENIQNVLKSNGKYNMIRVDYETLSFEDFLYWKNKEASSMEAKNKTLTCYYKDIPSMLQDIIKKNSDFALNIKYLNDIELKINFTFLGENEETLNSTVRFISPFALKLHDDYLTNTFQHLLNTEEYEKKVKYDTLRERLHKCQEEQKEHRQNNNKDDLEM